MSAPAATKLETVFFLEQSFSGADLGQGTVDENGGYSYLQVRYKYDELNHFRVRQYLPHFYNEQAGEMDAQFGDTVLQYDRTKWFSAGGMNFSATGRLYLPTEKTTLKQVRPNCAATLWALNPSPRL
ncbi:MAG: hypothetical protein R2827_15230 [Bdellovibrionales bacterium]